jgi:hypothetical protein
MKIKKRFTYANITATLALVFAMSGGALAASHYVITSTKQISPKVVKALKGQNGTAGAAGPVGPAGPVGAAGAAGAAGKEGPAGSAVAFAYIQGVSKPASLTNAKNVTSVTKVTSGGVEAAGEYCISVSVPFQNVTGTTDLEFGGGNGVTVSANTVIVPLVIAANDCPASTSVVVETGDEKEARDANFWISFN